ncbi:MAG: hypothetical protein ACYS76_04540 [Planctomycetota bacterium]|jgi:hypothetical protein
MSSRKWVSLVLLTNLILIAINPVSGQEYGEDSDSLGQFVDDFTDLNNVSVAVDVARNSTYNAMELNASGANRVYENYTDYTKVGADSALSVDDFNISYDQYARGTEEGYYSDRGAGAITNFTHEFELVVNNTEAGDADSRNMGHPWAIASYVGDFTGAPGGYDFLGLAIRNIGNTDDQFAFTWIGVQDGVVEYAIVGATLAVSNNVYYCRVSRTGGDTYFWAYSDSARTIPVAQLNDTSGDVSDAMRYLYGFHAVDAVGDAGDHFGGWVANLWIGNYSWGYDSSGYFTTEDYLDQVNGSSLVLMVNATIPTNTGITVEFSPDNSTWINQTALVDGFYSIDLRTLNYSSSFYLNYSLTTSDLSLTPRVYQSRLITTEGALGTTTTTTEGVNWLPIAIILGMALIFLGYKTRG